MTWGGSVLTGTDLGLLTSGVLFLVAVRRYPVASGFPETDHVARARVVETLQEAVFVTWAVTRLGGTVEFDENQPSASVVTVRFGMSDS